MSHHPPEPTMRSLFADTETIDWPAGATLRDNARRRARRAAALRTAAVVVAVVAVIVGASAVGADRRSAPPLPGYPSPSATASDTGPSSSASAGPVRTPSAAPPTSASTAAPVVPVPRSAFLQRDDAGPGQWIVTDDPDEGDWRLAFTLSHCPATYSTPTAGASPTSAPVEGASGLRGIRKADPSPDGILQTLSRLSPQSAAAAVYDEWRASAMRCRRFVSLVAPGTVVTVELVAEGFAGSRSMLIGVRSGGGPVSFHLFVAHGDMVSEIVFTPDNRQYGEQLGRKAAARMCAAQGTC